ncbi:MAG TPA: pirin family protein, partial [Kribbellaceae bacterium]|nr:pirin family protein [Kribbellaceae bacterium]
MSNPERDPAEIVCTEGERPLSIEVLAPREVPLGGPRAMRVRRTLPQRQRSLIGAWCFLDHYGPDSVEERGGMSVAPHPHTGLQTVSWLFSGEIEHRDSAGNHAMVRPGELNLMTAGRGISHSEVSTPETTILHGAQLWVALPDSSRFGDPGFEHYAPAP